MSFMHEAEDGALALDNTVSMGVDIVDVSRMRDILARTPSFAKRVFSEGEQKYCNASATPEFHYATRFAAKEAVVKALGTGFTKGIGVRDIEVVLNSKGKPSVKLYRRAAEVAKEQGVREIPISLSYTHNDAVACAMVITDNVVLAAQKRVNPTEELLKQFKEARTMLDDIDAPGKENADTAQNTLPGL